MKRGGEWLGLAICAFLVVQMLLQRPTYTTEDRGLVSTKDPKLTLQNSQALNATAIPVRHGAGNVSGDNNVLGFAVIGFPKCGTTSLSSMLDAHPSLASLHGENYFNLINKPEKLKKRLRHMLKQRKANGTTLVGYKQSHDLYHSSITTRNYAESFPTTPLIVTLRHPVKWFESYWNFRHNNNGKNWTLPFYPLKHVIKRRGNFREGFVTSDLHVGLGFFHQFLAQLGKTPLRNGTREMELLEYDMEDGEAAQVFPVPRKVPNRVFVVLTEQLENQNDNERILKDLQSFLRLDTPFDAIPHVRPDTLYLSQKVVERSKKESICKPKYKQLREKLLRIGEIASEWVLDYFLASDDVHFSGDFHSHMSDWGIDPCEVM